MRKKIWKVAAGFLAVSILGICGIAGGEAMLPAYAEDGGVVTTRANVVSGNAAQNASTAKELLDQMAESWRQQFREELAKRAVELSEDALAKVAAEAQKNNMTPEETASVVSSQKQEILNNTEKLVDAVEEAAKDKASQDIEDTTEEIKTHIPPENAATNFKVSSATLDSVTLQWTKSANTATYILAYWESGNTSTTQKQTLADIDRYTVNNLKHCKYKFVLYSANYRSDNTLTSNNPSVSLEAAPLPDVPKKVKVNNAREGYCSLRIKGLDPNNTNVYQSEAVLYDSDDKKLGVFDGNATGITITSAKLKADAFYHVLVRGYYENEDGTKSYGGWTENIYFGTQLSAVSAWQQKQVVTLVWKPVMGADGYTVYISKKANSGFKKVKVTTGKKAVVKKYGKKKLKAGKTYYFKVQAFTYKEGSSCTADSKSKRVSIGY